jgi:glycosyltransferase involved in cell wall biosynthesis
MIVLIPSYEPGWALIDLVVRLTEASEKVVVVSDGSGPEFTAILDEVRILGATVLEYETNRGKGFALKYGLAHIAERCPGEDVICADGDGQHTPAAIRRVADALGEAQGTIVLGARGFDGNVPLRSRFGNTATRVAMRLTSGIKLQDTQTGLRGYPAALLGWLMGIGGDRFEYELNILLEAKLHGIAIEEVPIETVYRDGNSSSHFRPIVDSVRVYLPLVKFGASSLGAAALDFALVIGLVAAGVALLPAVLVARMSSATLNFTVNRRLVFDPTGRTRVGRTLAGYGLVAGAVLVANYGVLYLLYRRLGLNLVLAKIATESVLFLASYHAQRAFVFRSGRMDQIVRPVVSEYR